MVGRETVSMSSLNSATILWRLRSLYFNICCYCGNYKLYPQICHIDNKFFFPLLTKILYIIKCILKKHTQRKYCMWKYVELHVIKVIKVIFCIIGEIITSYSNSKSSGKIIVWWGWKHSDFFVLIFLF